MLFANMTIRLLGSDDFPAESKQQAARDLTSAAAAGALHVDICQTYPLHRIADAHSHVDRGARGRILVDTTSVDEIAAMPA
jgi:NADPH2:quinone reductase